MFRNCILRFLIKSSRQKSQPKSKNIKNDLGQYWQHWYLCTKTTNWNNYIWTLRIHCILYHWTLLRCHLTYHASIHPFLKCKVEFNHTFLGHSIWFTSNQVSISSFHLSASCFLSGKLSWTTGWLTHACTSHCWLMIIKFFYDS